MMHAYSTYFFLPLYNSKSQGLHGNVPKMLDNLTLPPPPQQHTRNK